MKVKELNPNVFYFNCPGCGCLHGLHTVNPNDNSAMWTFNGDLDKPTFSPSLLVRFPYGDPPVENRCHSFIRDGHIQFLGDCTHSLKNQTVELPEWEPESQY
jgi:hypothetical protein